MFSSDIQRESSYMYFMIIIGVVQIFSMLSYSLFRIKFTVRGIYVIAIGFGILAYTLFTIIAVMGHFSFANAMFPGICVGMANGLSYVMITIFVASAVDYGEAKYGTRENSMLSSLQTLMSKLASAFAVFLAGVGLDFVKIDRNLAVQSDFVLFKLRMLFCIPSLLFVVASCFIFLHKKDLGRQNYSNISS